MNMLCRLNGTIDTSSTVPAGSPSQPIKFERVAVCGAYYVDGNEAEVLLALFSAEEL